VGYAVVGVAVVGRDDLHPTGQCVDAEQALSHLFGVGVGKIAQQQWAFHALVDAVELPRQVADEGVPLAGRTTEPGV
jgi:hypothetical protein